MNASTAIALALQDEFDAHAAKELEATLTALSQTDMQDIVIDLSNVSFVDSCGIGAIVFLYKRLKSRGKTLRLLNVNGQPRQLFHMLRIDKAIPLISSAEI
ncbi:STAS domain-containing protein [Thaumasiovibrio sp. DFM-14]|uniref:STAS domain-containing protein n=1 Tax=Thaumasiovibrio sp. DFM-14 TaxID=3384792 RepID=UPI0039A17790